MAYDNKELARMTLDALGNPNNIYHERCMLGVTILMQLFGLAYSEAVKKIEDILNH